MNRFALPLLAAAALAGCSPMEAREGPPPFRVTHEMIDRALESAAHAHVRVPARALVADYDGGTYGWSSDLAREVAGALERSAYLVPEATIQGPLPAWNENNPMRGIENQRLLAALQGCRYAVLTRAQVDHDEGWTPLRLLYIGLVTMFLVPGETLETRATLEASLVDVHSGAVLLRASVEESERSSFILVGNTRSAKREHEREIAARAAPRLAERIDLGIRRALSHACCRPPVDEACGARVARGWAPAGPPASSPRRRKQACAASAPGGFFEERDRP